MTLDYEESIYMVYSIWNWFCQSYKRITRNWTKYKSDNEEINVCRCFHVWTRAPCSCRTNGVAVLKARHHLKAARSKPRHVPLINVPSAVMMAGEEINQIRLVKGRIQWVFFPFYQMGLRPLEPTGSRWHKVPETTEQEEHQVYHFYHSLKGQRGLLWEAQIHKIQRSKVKLVVTQKDRKPFTCKGDFIQDIKTFLDQKSD